MFSKSTFLCPHSPPLSFISSQLNPLSTLPRPALSFPPCLFPPPTHPSRRGPIDLEAKFEPNLLNTAVFLLGLSQQVSTFAINYQGRPFREGIRENPALYWGLVGASCVAFSGSTDFMPEMNRWLQVVAMEGSVSVFCPFSSSSARVRNREEQG